MPRKDNQKKKLLALREIFLTLTDENHPLTISQIIVELERYGISAERRSLYDDFALLEEFGLEVMHVRQGSTTAYYAAGREYDLVELKFMIDCIQASRFITERKAQELIKKMRRLCSKYEADQLRRQNLLVNRIRHLNETVYYSIDAINDAINNDRKISFYYFDYNVNKQKEYRHGKKLYLESPFVLCYKDESYYLLAYSTEKQGIKNYRVDRMENVTIKDEPREGADVFRQLDLDQYSQRSFALFSGQTVNVTLRFHKRYAGTIFGRFGMDVMIRSVDEKWFEITTPIVVSPLFYAWIYGFEDGAYIVGPDFVREAMKDHLAKVSQFYET